MIDFDLFQIVGLNLSPFKDVLLTTFISLSVLIASCLFYLKRKQMIGVLCICILCIILIYSHYKKGVDEVFSVDYQVGITSFYEIVEENVWTYHVDVISLEEGQYIEVIILGGLIPSVLRLASLRSGMPAYIFDKQGILYDYTIDRLDDVRYQNKWLIPDKRTASSEKDVLELFKARQNK